MSKHLSFFSSSVVLGGGGGAAPGPAGGVRPPLLEGPAAGSFRMRKRERPLRMSWILRFSAAFLSGAGPDEVAFPVL